jgi:hypothetical protein
MSNQREHHGSFIIDSDIADMRAPSGAEDWNDNSVQGSITGMGCY